MGAAADARSVAGDVGERLVHLLGDGLRLALVSRRRPGVASVTVGSLVPPISLSKIILPRSSRTILGDGALRVRYTQRAYSDLRVWYKNACGVLTRLPQFCSASGKIAGIQTDIFHSIIKKDAPPQQNACEQSQRHPERMGRAAGAATHALPPLTLYCILRRVINLRTHGPHTRAGSRVREVMDALRARVLPFGCLILMYNLESEYKMIMCGFVNRSRRVRRGRHSLRMSSTNAVSRSSPMSLYFSFSATSSSEQRTPSMDADGVSGSRRGACNSGGAARARSSAPVERPVRRKHCPTLHQSRERPPCPRSARLLTHANLSSAFA
ncbi:hypothetical protein EVAR_92730_1 [Eumeta japonica]|uniref:Uncharacterized protein n=1 Tax=Eumeta variegata TaxID=151549 RepID=A0A4C1SY16_EUMVA|nr:hypothetical protein EVAR_92730_1 [Eumeta japonica]